MRRSDLLAALRRENPGLRANEVARIVDQFFAEIAERMASGERVELRGFGTFRAVAREPQIGRNPATGEPVAIPARRLPQFRPTKSMNGRVRGD